MTTTRQRLARLNELREQNDLPPLKTWKASRAKLEEAIAKLNADDEDAGCAEPKATKAKASKANGKAPARKSSLVADWARKNGKNAKVVRAALRKAGHSAPYTLATVKSVFADA